MAALGFPGIRLDPAPTRTAAVEASAWTAAPSEACWEDPFAASPARIGPIDPSHRLERLGRVPGRSGSVAPFPSAPAAFDPDLATPAGTDLAVARVTRAPGPKGRRPMTAKPRRRVVLARPSRAAFPQGGRSPGSDLARGPREALPR